MIASAWISFLLLPVSANAAARIDPDTKMLERAIEAVAAQYLAPVGPDRVAGFIVDAINAADDKAAMMARCEQQAAPPATDLKPSWLAPLDAAVQCSRTLRGNAEARLVLDAAVSRAARRVDSNARFMRRLGGISADYYIAISPHVRPGTLGISLANPDESGSLIKAVSPEWPADRAGLVPGDRIVAVDDVPVSTLAPGEIAYRLEASPGSEINLTIRNVSNATKRVRVTTVERPTTLGSADTDPKASLHTAEVLAPSTMRSELRSGVLVIAIPRMVYGQTERDVGSLLKTAMRSADRPRAILLDLRRNPEGELASAGEVADLFLDRGIVLKLEGRAIGSRIATADVKVAVPSELPLFVLIDESCGGATEVLAAALADNGRATIIGRPTRSDGLVRIMVDVGGDRAVSVPQGRIYRANGRLLSEGVEPAILLDAGMDDAAELDNALKVISAKIST